MKFLQFLMAFMFLLSGNIIFTAQDSDKDQYYKYESEEAAYKGFCDELVVQYKQQYKYNDLNKVENKNRKLREKIDCMNDQIIELEFKQNQLAQLLDRKNREIPLSVEDYPIFRADQMAISQEIDKIDKEVDALCLKNMMLYQKQIKYFSIIRNLSDKMK